MEFQMAFRGEFHPFATLIIDVPGALDLEAYDHLLQFWYEIFSKCLLSTVIHSRRQAFSL
jgi:hypothetical protein